MLGRKRNAELKARCHWQTAVMQGSKAMMKRSLVSLPFVGCTSLPLRAAPAGPWSAYLASLSWAYGSLMATMQVVLPWQPHHSLEHPLNSQRIGNTSSRDIMHAILHTTPRTICMHYLFHISNSFVRKFASPLKLCWRAYRIGGARPQVSCSVIIL